MREPKGCGAFPRAQRRAIGLHDSKVRSVQAEGGSLRIRLSAYVHVSAGEPGTAAGTGWEQEIDLVIGEARLVEAPAGALWISDGQVGIDGVAHTQLLLPLDASGAVRVELEGAEGRLVLDGRSLRSEERGDPRFVERLE